MTVIKRKWTITMAIQGATPEDWLTNVQMSGPPVRPGEVVEVVPADQLKGTVEALSRIADLDDEYGEETAAGAIAADALVDLGVRPTGSGGQ